MYIKMSKKGNYGSFEENMDLLLREPIPEAQKIRSFEDHNHSKCEKLIERKSPERKLELKK